MSTWNGWQVGMSGKVVQIAKQKLKAKFSYAKDLDNSQLFTQLLQQVLTEYQQKENVSLAAASKPLLRTDGVLDWATKVALGVIAPASPLVNADGTDNPNDHRPVLFTVAGTYADMWSGYPADTARAVEDLAYWQPIDYPATPFPMWPSIMTGYEELVAEVLKYMGLNPNRDIWLAGYSQGAIVVALVWVREFVNPNGRLHRFLSNVKKAVTWGNPCRELGKANGNVRVGWPVPQGQGILEHRIVGTPDWWCDFAHGANSQWGRDMYTDTSVDATGADETAVCDIIMQETLFGGPIALLKQVLSIPNNPITNLVDAFKALVQAGMFFGGGTGPHVDYDIQPAIDYFRS